MIHLEAVTPDNWRLGLCVREEQLQLPDFVPAQPQAGEIVPLDINVGIQPSADILQPVHRRREKAKFYSGKIIQLFHRFPPFDFRGYRNAVQCTV